MAGRGPNFRPEEDEILRNHYRKRGARWCSEHLPGRSEVSISRRVIRLGIARSVTDITRPTSELIDAHIRRAYTGERPKGFVSQCAKAIGRSRDWVAKRALDLGLIQSRDHHPWSEAELAFASKLPSVSAKELSRRMRRRGWQRSPSSIAYMRRAGNVEHGDDRLFTAWSLAEVMGVSTATVTGWIGRGLLRANRRGWERTAAQNGDGYVIHERDVAAFIIQRTAHVSLTKLEPNKFWLIDLIARYGAPATMTGRQRRGVPGEQQVAA